MLASIAWANPTVVRIEHNAVHCVGPITAIGNNAVEDAVASQNGAISWLVITSDGGELNVSMDLGNWVFSNQLNVRIVDHCFSACANYVFPAERIKMIEIETLVAWHGSAVRSIHQSHREISEVIDRDILPSLLGSQRARKRSELIANTISYLRTVQTRQAEFFAKIGVDERITTTGKSSSAVRDFWFLSEQSMNSFGIKSVVTPPNYAATDTSRFGRNAIVFIEHNLDFK